MKTVINRFIEYLSVAGPVAVIFLFVYLILDSYDYRDRFKSGDCVSLTIENEFTKKVIYYRVEAVGKEHYLIRMVIPNIEVLSPQALAEPKRYINSRFELEDVDVCPVKVYGEE